jgi:hypothetical protein
MAKKKRAREARKQSMIDFGEWESWILARKERRDYWEKKLACLQEPIKESVIQGMIALDIKAEEAGMDYGENYYYLPKMPTMAYLDLHHDQTFNELSDLFEASTLFWAGINKSLEETAAMFNIEDTQSIELLIFTSDLSSFWSSKNLDKKQLLEMYTEGKELFTSDQLREWIRYYGGIPFSHFFGNKRDEDGNVIPFANQND